MLTSQKMHGKFETTPNICVETDSPKCIASETTTSQVHEIRESNETSTSPRNLTLPGPRYN